MDGTRSNKFLLDDRIDGTRSNKLRRDDLIDGTRCNVGRRDGGGGVVDFGDESDPRMMIRRRS